MRGLERFPESDWPDFIPLVYYSYHVMVGLGTIFIAILVVAALLLCARSAVRVRAGCCGFCCSSLPFPYIANTAGWITAEAGTPAVADLWA